MLRSEGSIPVIQPASQAAGVEGEGAHDVEAAWAATTLHEQADAAKFARSSVAGTSTGESVVPCIAARTRNLVGFSSQETSLVLPRSISGLA